MAQRRYPAVFMRGGTSKGVFFRETDLPAGREARDDIFLGVIGSPDPYGRQLDGMGGGISSLSKAVVVGPASRPDADLDYIFAQVAVGDAMVDYSANCGNLSSAVGPFAIDTGLFPAGGGDRARVRLHNINSGKIIHADIPLQDGKARVGGGFAIPGVAGTGARIRLDYLDPAGTATGGLLPSGRPVDWVTLPGEGAFELSLVDASTPAAFVAAERLGLTGAETVAELEADAPRMALLERLRREAALLMGLAESPDSVRPAAPKIAIVAPPRPWRTLRGDTMPAAAADLAARMLSMGQVHRALPLTGAMCLAVACRLPGTVANRQMAPGRQGAGDVRLANPSGVLPVAADIADGANGPAARSVTVYRTARMLMRGEVYAPG